MIQTMVQQRPQKISILEIYFIVFQYFLFQFLIFSPWDLSKKMRLEILFKMVQFSFQNSLMAPSYDPNTVLVHPPLKKC